VRLERTFLTAEHVDELVVHDLDECLTGIEAARDLLAEGSIAHAIHERLGHGQRDVGFE